MTDYQLFCVLAALALIISLLSSRFHSLQETIAITGLAMLLSLIILVVGKLFELDIHIKTISVLQRLDFQALLLNGMLGFLLFAGALQIRLKVLASQKWEILCLALLGTVISTLTVAALCFYLMPLLGLALPWSYCLLFGALISPTDPIAVLTILKKLGAPEDIAIQVEGESLFNDGIGLVLFVAVSQLAFSAEALSLADVGALFFHEAVGGIAYGLALAFALHQLMKLTDEETQRLLITLVVPTAGYVMAEKLSVSGPLAMVAAGIVLGNFTVPKCFGVTGRILLQRFWGLLEHFFNSLLFLLLGLLLLLTHLDMQLWWFVLLSIPVVLLARCVSVYLPYLGFRRMRQYSQGAEGILIWGGLKGGLALAMAMSIPAGIVLTPELELRDLLLVMTYAVVVFSIMVQGSTVSRLIRRSREAAEAGKAAAESTQAV
ncbi:sodium:proton antiporter [Shewanella algae]|uniref:cation:proton antiporter n=1 Tax=Shewanella algae TaxID=38313 RepID=UPI0031F56324